jgi:ABC-2 type transport system ATP-binding protein
VLNQKDDVRKTLGYVPQKFGVYSKVSAEELLDRGALLEALAERHQSPDVGQGHVSADHPCRQLCG